MSPIDFQPASPVPIRNFRQDASLESSPLSDPSGRIQALFIDRVPSIDFPSFDVLSFDGCCNDSPAAKNVAASSPHSPRSVDMQRSLSSGSGRSRSTRRDGGKSKHGSCSYSSSAEHSRITPSKHGKSMINIRPPKCIYLRPRRQMYERRARRCFGSQPMSKNTKMGNVNSNTAKPSPFNYNAFIRGLTRRSVSKDGATADASGIFLSPTQPGREDWSAMHSPPPTRRSQRSVCCSTPVVASSLSMGQLTEADSLASDAPSRASSSISSVARSLHADFEAEYSSSSSPSSPQSSKSM